MTQSIWLPFWINIALLLLAVPTIRLLPDTRVALSATTSNTADIENLDETGPLLGDGSGRYSNAFETKAGCFQGALHAVRKTVRLVTGRRNFQVLLVSPAGNRLPRLD